MMKNWIIGGLVAALALALVGGIVTARHSQGNAEVAVWQSAGDSSKLWVSTRGAGDEWQTHHRPLTLSAHESGDFLLSNVVSFEVKPEEEPVMVRAVGATATATMMGPDGSAMGTVTFVQGPHSVVISADMHGLAPGGHGFHIHMTGACEPDFSAAGGHYAPRGALHGVLVGPSHHAGDLPNLFAAADGTARADVFTDAVTLAAGEVHSLFDADGSAIIIHEKPDSYGEAPQAGARVACGVIQLDG